MITHQIVKHKPRVKLPELVSQHLPALPGAHIPPIRNNSGVCVFMGKLEYSKMLETLRLKRGQYCFFKEGASYPLRDTDIWKVVDINEIHYHDKGNNITDKRPTPYYLKNKAGDERWANDEMLIGFRAPGVDW